MRVPFLAVLAMLPCAVRAQEIPDSAENIVVTATRVPSAAAELPAAVTVIDRRTIEERGYVSLVDALSAVPGLRVVQSGGPGSQTSVFVRGTNSNHVLVLRDGVPVNDPGDPGGAFNFGVDTLVDVDRIEVVRGPLSSLYGSGALGGVINLITRHGAGAPHGSVTLAAGAPRAGLAQGDVAGGFGIYDYAAQVEGLSERGFDQTPSRERAIYTGERDGDRSKQAQVELGVTPFADTRFSVLLRARDAKYGYEDIGGVVYDGGNATGYDSNLFGRLGVTSKLLAGAWNTSLYLTRLQDDRRYTVTPTAADPNDDEGDSRYHGRRTDAQWNNTVRLPDYAGVLTGSSLAFGCEHQADQAHVKIDESFGGFAYQGTVRAHADTDAGYAGVQSTAFGRLAMTAQLREDATTIGGEAFTWRVGGVLAMPEVSSRIKASYGTAFRAPALNDRYGVDVFGYRGNPDLRPERSRSWEAGVESDLPVSPRYLLTLGVTYFDNRINDLIQVEYAADFSSTPLNILRARAHGVEATVTLKAAQWLQADLTYTYTDARDLATHVQLTRRPYDQGSANVRITPVAAVVIAPEVVYTGGFADYLTNDTGELPGSVIGQSGSGVVFNLNATWRVTRIVELFAWGKNLANSRFEPVAGYQTPGASFLAGTRLHF